MNRFLPMLLAVGLALTWFGCNSSTDSGITATSTGAGQTATSDATLVTLKVPNMT